MKELNIINKILTMVMVTTIIFLSHNDLIIYLISSLGIICSLLSKRISLIFIFTIPVIGTFINIELDLIQIKVMLDFILVIAINKIIIDSFTINQRQYIYEKTLYRFKDYKGTKKHLKRCYYDIKYKENFDSLIKYNGINNNRFLKEQAILKTKNDMKDIYLLYKLRFYQIYNRKKTLFPDRWKKYDTLYLLIIITVFILFLYIK